MYHSSTIRSGTRSRTNRQSTDHQHQHQSTIATTHLVVESDTTITSQMDDQVGSASRVLRLTTDIDSSITVRSPNTTHHTPSKRRRITYQPTTTATMDEDDGKKSELNANHEPPPQLDRLPTNDLPAVGVTDRVNMDEDESMKEVISPKSDVSMNQVNFSLIHHLTFGTVMVEPCMMRMLEFTSIHDRIRSMVVSRHWSYMIRLPRLWSDARLSLQYGDPTDIDRMPGWLLNSIGRLSLHLDPSHVIILQQLPCLQHLLLHFKPYSIKDGVFTMNIPLLGTALQALHLVSFDCRYLTPQMMQCLFVPSLVESRPPPIHYWTNTLTHLEVEVNHAESIHPTLVGDSEYVWPQLILLNIRLIGLSTKSILVITKLLTRTRFPLLQCLSYLFVFSRHVNGDVSEQTQLCDPLFASIQQELDQLTTLSSLVDVTDGPRGFKYYQVYQLSPGLTNLHLRFNDCQVYPYVGCLQYLQSLTLTCCHLGPLILGHQFFTAIGHHNLPKLHTLQLMSFEREGDRNIDDSGERIDDIIHIMKEMVTLTSLEIVLYWRRNDIRSYWLESIHYFPNLTKLTCHIEKTSFLGLYESIGVAPKLETFWLKLPSTDLSHIVQAWSRRAPNLLTSSSPHLSHIRRFRLSMPFQRSPYPRVSFSADHIIQLQCLSQLTDLSLSGPIEPHTPAMKVLADLPQLRSLCLWVCVLLFAGCLPLLESTITIQPLSTTDHVTNVTLHRQP